MFIKSHKHQNQISSFREFSSMIQPKLKFNAPARVFPNSVESFNTKEIMNGISKDTKMVFLELKNKKTFEIQFKIKEENALTVGWLLSEAIRKMKEYYDSKNLNLANEAQILYLTSVDKNYNLDHWLTFLYRSISVLRDGQTLTPFYGDINYEIHEKTEKIDLNYFHFQKIIGVGGFSQVILVRRKDNGLFYAIKIIDKNVILKKQKEKIIFNEKNNWKSMSNDFIVKLHCTFQNKENLFFVMDYCPGGELFFHLQKKGKIHEDECKFLAYEILMAIDYLHENCIIYRDLKPENVLIDIDGHIKLTDFGLSKKLPNRNHLTYTFCGSPEYLAPEMINRSGHNVTLDFYCIGVFIYEIAAGFPPTLGSKKSSLFSEILKNNIKFPSYFSQSLKSLITSLIDKNPNKRLGANGGVKEILNHEWFFPINQDDIFKKTWKPTIKPNVYHFYVDEEIQKKVINYSDFSTKDEENGSPANPLMKKFEKFSFIFPTTKREKNKLKNEMKKYYVKEASEMIVNPFNRHMEVLKGDCVDGGFNEMMNSEIG